LTASSSADKVKQIWLLQEMLMSDPVFKLTSRYQPTGDQPQAIAELLRGIRSGENHQVLMGVTGSGKTFTMANVIAACNMPAMVLAHNKTLAAQLYSEFCELFPENAVEYFVSYYDYYQPEAYVPTTDTYIDKESSINDEIDRMRLSATRSLFERRDVIIVSSVSCIYGLGSAEDYHAMALFLARGTSISRRDLTLRLIQMQYERKDIDFHRGTFRVRGDVVEIFPAYEEELALRVEFWGDEVESVKEIDPLRGKVVRELPKTVVYPATHYVVSEDVKNRALGTIKIELEERLAYLRSRNMLLEAQRLEQRTRFDMEMIEELGYCSGIENYSRHLTGRGPGQPPPCLLDFFPEDWLLFIDESHVTVSQVRGMYRGDLSRKQTLVDFGFRLPSAIDNRPLKFDEFEQRTRKVIYVSATPGDYELEKTQGVFVEQVIRPTGLLDPLVEIRPVASQVDDLLDCIRDRAARNQRVLVTTLTKRMAEELTSFYKDLGVRVQYLHSEIRTIERMKIIRDLRLGKFDVLIGINLLREGLDIPEVSLVAILEADKEGFLRSERSLIQTMGRAARNADGQVILYADVITESMRKAMDETQRRREKQMEFNRLHGITPQTIIKDISEKNIYANGDYLLEDEVPVDVEAHEMGEKELRDEIARLEKEMFRAAEVLDFEKAADLRDQMQKLKKEDIFRGQGRSRPRAALQQ